MSGADPCLRSPEGLDVDALARSDHVHRLAGSFCTAALWPSARVFTSEGQLTTTVRG